MEDTMNLNIPESSVFYMILREPNGKIIKDSINPIANHLSFTPHQERIDEKDRWGFVKWYIF